MVDKRNRIIEFIESCGAEVNVGKNKAWGNKGIFRAGCTKYRIDVAKDLPDDEILRVLVHEFIHFLHYGLDKTMKCIDFFIPNLNDEIEEELISVTVDLIDKASVKTLYEAKNRLNSDIKELSEKIRCEYPYFCLSKPLSCIEKRIKKSEYGYLLKYDRVRVGSVFKSRFYSVDDVNFYALTEAERDYVRIKSKQRMLKRINSRMNRLNKYYNKQSELVARSFEKYFTDKIRFKEMAPNLCSIYDDLLRGGRIPELSEFAQILI